MLGFFKRPDEVERALHARRERPSTELLHRIEARVQVETRARRERRSFRLAAPVLLTVAAAVALSAVGGVSYAATKVQSAASGVTQIFGLESSQHVSVMTSGRDQYRSGYGWGSSSHSHTGAPGIGQSGSLRPPLFGKRQGPTVYVTSTFTIDEQAHLWVSVIGDDGTEYLITQTKSRIGEGIHGVQAKNINYLVLIPRTVPIKLAIPQNLLLPGHHYRIRIIARAHNFQKKTLYIGFTMPKV